MKIKIILIAYLISLTSIGLNAFHLSETAYLGLETGFGFSSYTELNQGINNTASSLESIYGASAIGQEFKELIFEIPIILKFGLRPFEGTLGQKLSFFIKTGYNLTFSWNDISYNNSEIEYKYNVGIIPIELGAEYRLFKLKFMGTSFSIYGGISAGIYFGYFSNIFTDSQSASGINADLYPQNYSGNTIGGTLSLTAVWRLSGKVSLTGTVSYRYAIINNLTGDIKQDDGTTRKEQLYISDTGFVSSDSQPAGTIPGKINLRGFSFSFGIQFSFGEKRYSNIPEGLYR